MENRTLINRMAYLKRTNRQEYIKYKNKINEDKMTKLLNGINKTDNNINKTLDIIDDNDTNDTIDETTKNYLKKYNLPLKIDTDTINTLLNRLSDDEEYLKILEIIIKNKDVYTPDKYISNIKMLLIDNYNILYNELNGFRYHQ